MIGTGTLLVAEGAGRRLQEVSVTGQHIRCIGEGVFDDAVR